MKRVIRTPLSLCYFSFDIEEMRATPIATPPPRTGKSFLAPGDCCIRITIAIMEIAQMIRFAKASR